MLRRNRQSSAGVQLRAKRCERIEPSRHYRLHRRAHAGRTDERRLPVPGVVRVVPVSPISLQQ